MKLIFEKSVPGRGTTIFDPLSQAVQPLPDSLMRGDPPALPEVSELEVIRHFTGLSRRNFGVDSHFYPLGSCTMKYNPRIDELTASLPGFTGLHPHWATIPAARALCQGALAVIWELERFLAEIGGMKAGCLQPMAGAHGELAGVLMIAAYHRTRGNHGKKVMLVPDSAHGTNPASAAMAGFSVRTVPSAPNGEIDFDAFRAALDETVAGVMLTCPNTHGLFERQVAEIARLAHEQDALLYYDGANLNAILGKVRPGDLGFDVMHFNLHKTFSTPHGMGGPGSGAVAVGERLEAFLPGPRIIRGENGDFDLMTPEHSIGAIAPFFGSFLVGLRAWTYIRAHGRDGLPKVAEAAVLNANYVLARLKDHFHAPFGDRCMHECVLNATRQVAAGQVKALDIAKALLDRGFHAPTVYFPLTVPECLMIEPTETESRETLDAFCEAMIEIARLAEADPEALKQAPTSMPVGRLDEVKAARELNCSC